MSGPYGPNGPGEGNNDPTQVWGGQPGAGAAPQWGGAPGQPQAQPTQHWGDPNAQPQQQAPNPWGQPQQGQPQQPAQQWGAPQQSAPQHPQQQWGQQPQQQDWAAQAAAAQAQQWGQPQAQPQPGQQQWGAPQQPQGQWPPQQPPLTPQGGKKSKGLIIGLGIGAVAVIAAIIGLILVVMSSDELDSAAVQSGVARVLKDSYGIADVADVKCPSGQQVEVDHTFSCDLKVSGEQKKVQVKVTKDDGTYEVGRPS
ncbi:DUF4333 domain-containing protein [Nocardia camponoti]|uniref:DUF4333 domain-containing protein n=1 Tax=Nocardia camponoti TaxID=1616106 RepID=A0A917QA09_9NOCA|nr:DUF4333 domain-containing protein [Nocardia camponoti]GGK37294.1 hypothetical protein GCM10011591_06190 [Nocardia camponoti]